MEIYHQSMKNTLIGRNDFPIRSTITIDDNKKLILVIGDNAEGKTFITSTIAEHALQHFNIRSYNIGMQLRTTRGVESSMVYSSETIHSTGFSTLRSVTGGVKNCINHAKTNYNMMLILDEPTLGLSERYERPMGEYIATSIKENDHIDNFKGIFW